MKVTKPDRFDEIVKARLEKDGGLWSDNVANLLRREHRSIVRMVKGMATRPYFASDVLYRKEILDLLKKRAT